MLNKKNFMKLRRLTLIQGLIIAAVVLAVGIGVVYFLNTREETSIFTDQLGNEQKITNFDECMEWVMPTRVEGKNVICTAPGDVSFTAACKDVPELNCKLANEE